MAFVHMRDSGVHMVAGKFAGGTSPSVSVGKGFTVAYSATGVYTVTLKGPLPKGTAVLHCSATIWSANAVATGEPMAITVTSATAASGAVVFQAYEYDTSGDPQPAATPSTDFVSFLIVYAQSSLVA